MQKKNLPKAYIIIKALPITKMDQIIGLKKFAKAVLDPKQEVFIVYVATFFMEPKKVYPDQKVQIAVLIANKASVTIPVEYSDFENVFFKKFATVLPEHIKINTHVIDLEKTKQPLYRLIYSLGLVELKIFNTYIKINLVNSFICPLKSPASTPILFDKKLDGSFQLCINY